MATDDREEDKPKRVVNFRQELLQYQSFRNQQEVYTSDDEGSENKGSNIWRNFVSQCSAGFLAVFAVIPSRNLQTSIHAHNDLGKVSLVCMYVSYVLGCCLSGLILQRFKAKCLLLSSLFFHILYSVANVIPSAYTLLPASCLVGLCQPAFYRVQDSLLLGYGLRYAAMTSLAPQSALRLFQTVSVVTVHSAQILGNLLSSGLISASDFHCEENWGEEDAGKLHLGAHHPGLSNDSHGHRSSLSSASSSLGASGEARSQKWTYTLPFIPIQTRRAPDGSPPVNFYQLLTLIYLCMSVVAMGAVLIFFESPDVAVQRRPHDWRQKAREVQKVVTDLRWLLVWFAASYIGFAQGIIISDISKEFGSEVFGCFVVGYMMVTFGTGNLLAILLLDKLRACSTHPLFLATGFLMNIGVLILTSLWKPEEGESSQLLLYTAFWGVVDGVLQSQVQAVVGRYAREERDTAMMGFRVLQGCGLVAAFLVSLFTANLMTSLYVALPLHVVGFLGLILTTNEVSQRERSLAETDGSPQYSPQLSPSHRGEGDEDGGHDNPRMHGEYCDISGEV